MTRRLTVIAPGSIGNVGPGFDVLGLAISGLAMSVTLEQDGGGMLLGAVRGRDAELLPADPEKNGALLAARLVFEDRHVSPGIALSIDNGLPFSGGLGGSASSAVAGAAAALAWVGEPLEPRELMHFALQAETRLSGWHLDNIAASVLGGLTLTRDTETLDAVRIPILAPWHVALVTPRARVATKEARKILPQSWERSLWTRQMAQTAALVHAFEASDAGLLRRALHDAFAEPLRSHLIPYFYDIKEAALANGALGCSISGSGPTVFAIAETEPEAQQAASAMARACGGDPALMHVCPVDAEGVKIVSDTGS